MCIRDRLNIPELEMNGLGYSRFILKEGGTLGDLYSKADLVRNDKGYIEMDANGALDVYKRQPQIKTKDF